MSYIEHCKKRLSQLNALAPPTGKLKDSYLNRLLNLTNQLRHCPSVYKIVPLDVVHFLISLDKGAKTRLHVPDCTWRGKQHARMVNCGCPVRAGASSVRTARKMIAKGLSEAGLLTDWSEQTASGNPARSRLVRDFEAAINREQLQADVRGVQAPLFDSSVFEALQTSILTAVRRAAKDKNWLTAVNNLTDAFLYSFMFYTGDRLSDALLRDWSRITELQPSSTPTPLGWRIRRGQSKTRQHLDGNRTHDLPNDGSPWHPIQLASLLAAASKSAGLEVRPGRLFKLAAEAAPGKLFWSKALLADAARRRFAKWIGAIKAPPAITLHSFHPSHAVWRLQAGHNQQEILTDMMWSSEQLWRYLDQPLLSMNGVVLGNATASLRVRVTPLVARGAYRGFTQKDGEHL